MSARRALILDCDGVLADTELDGHLVAFNQVFEEIGAPFRWSAEEYSQLLKVGGGKERLLSFLAAHPEYAWGTPDETAARVAQIHKRKSDVYVELVASGALPGRPGLARLVEEALDSGWQVAVASTSAEKSVEAVLHSVVGPQIRSRMSGVFAGDIVPAKKPAPDIYQLAVRELGRTPDEVVVVEDSGAGAAAAAAAGLSHVVTVSHFTAEDAFPAATTVVDHLGGPGAASKLIDGLDVRNPGGIIDVDSLESVISVRASKESAA